MRVYGVDASPNEVMACPPTRGLCLTSLSVCSHPLQGNTPLHVCATYDHYISAKRLLECKADVNATNEVGEAWWWVRRACVVDCILAMR